LRFAEFAQLVGYYDQRFAPKKVSHEDGDAVQAAKWDGEQQLAQRIADALRAPVRVADRDVVVSASIGIALSTPRQSRPDTLLRTADTAMYQAKAAGKARLEGTLTEYGDSIFESPIVIEGYCGSGRSADQLRLSHSRAILVRQYVQSHFQLDSGNLGIVPMKSSPPNGVKPTTWDGICIVVLKRKSK